MEGGGNLGPAPRDPIRGGRPLARESQRQRRHPHRVQAQSRPRPQVSQVREEDAVGMGDKIGASGDGDHRVPWIGKNARMAKTQTHGARLPVKPTGLGAVFERSNIFQRDEF